MKRVIFVSGATIAGVALSAASAFGAWSAGGAGNVQATAARLTAPSALGTSAGSPSHTAINVTFTPASNPTGTTYTVTRDKKKDGTVGPEVACSGLTTSPCADSGLTPLTTYTYTVKAVRNTWSAQAPGSTSRTTSAAPVVVATHYSLSMSATSATNGTNNWRGTALMTVTDNLGNKLGGYVVRGNWDGENAKECTTAASGVDVGTCSIVSGNVSNSILNSVFTLVSVTKPPTSLLLPGTHQSTVTASKP